MSKSYIPPHKRHPTNAQTPSPSPDSIAPLFSKSPNLTSHRNEGRGATSKQGTNIVYASGAVSLWWPIGGPWDHDQIPASFHLDPVSCEAVERKWGEKPLVLVNSGAGDSGEERPWVRIGERIEPFLFDSVRRAREEIGLENEEIKMSFIARIGKVHFDGGVCLDSIRKAAVAEVDSRNLVRKSFYTSIRTAYMKDIQCTVVPKIGLQFDSAKEHFHVKVFDKSHPDVTISCKCTVAGNGSGLEIHKIEKNHSRHLVVDLSCLYKDLDLRLILVNKKIFKNPSDEEMDAINQLIKSAILDPNIKGGLRWPLGKDSVGERFRIVGVWHTNYKAFRGETMRLKLRHADRFDHRASSGEVSDEVTMKLTGISKKFRDGDLDKGPLMEMVQDAVKLIWDYFLSYNNQSP